MADERPVQLTPEGPPETVLPEPPPEAAALLESADPEEVVRRHPRWSEAWAALGDRADGVEAYAYYRVGYHRGLDALRAAGWRGSGYVRWRHQTNRGFLRCLEGLRAQAEAIGEHDEAQRCAEFLHQLDPDWDRRDA